VAWNALTVTSLPLLSLVEATIMPVNDNVVTGNAVLGLRGFCALQAMAMYLKSEGRMRLSRNATPANLRAIATEFTGKQYPRSRNGLQAAYLDLHALSLGKSLDQLGEVVRVNQAVGGVASDLQ
jgi:hypothetical protein